MTDNASWRRRAGASVVDGVVLAPFYALALILGRDDDGTLNLFFLTFCLIGLAVHGYNRWFQAGESGQSWGRKAFGLLLVGEGAGRPIGTVRAFARDVAHLLDCLPCFLGFLWPLWDRNRQTFADKLAKTVVVLDL